MHAMALTCLVLIGIDREFNAYIQTANDYDDIGPWWIDPGYEVGFKKNK